MHAVNQGGFCPLSAEYNNATLLTSSTSDPSCNFTIFVYVLAMCGAFAFGTVATCNLCRDKLEYVRGVMMCDV